MSCIWVVSIHVVYNHSCWLEDFSDTEILMKISVGRSSLIIILVLLALLHFDCGCARSTCERSCVISGIRNFSVRYAQRPAGLLRFLRNRGGEGERKEVIGTDSITAQFSGITAIVGPPGSGKSTLIKGLHLQSQEGVLPKPSN